MKRISPTYIRFGRLKMLSNNPQSANLSARKTEFAIKSITKPTISMMVTTSLIRFNAFQATKVCVFNSLDAPKVILAYSLGNDGYIRRLLWLPR